MRKQRFLMWHFKNRRVCFAVAEQFDSMPGCAERSPFLIGDAKPRSPQALRAITRSAQAVACMLYWKA
jgi:hypothetical protein